MLDFDEKFRKAETLFKRGDNKNLELYFAKVLPSTYNIQLWELYLNYIKSVNKDALELAYSFTVQHLGFHYEIYPILNEYISILNDVEKIREVYYIGLTNPIHNLGLLYKNYEEFENSLNKVTAKSIINEKLPVYQNTFKLYQRLLPHLENEFESIDKIIELESEERKEKVILYFIEKYSYREDLYFLYSELLMEKVGDDFDEESETVLKIRSVLEKGIKITESLNLKCYFSFLFKDTNYLDLQNESALICYFNILSQKGESDLLLEIENHFKNGEERIVALDYAAKLYYSLTLDKEKTYEIYSLGLPLVNERMFDFFVSIYDLEMARKVFNSCELSYESKRKMAFMEFTMGSLSNLRKCFKKEDFFYEFKSLFSEHEFLWNNLPTLDENSVFRKINSNDCISLLKKIKY